MQKTQGPNCPENDPCEPFCGLKSYLGVPKRCITEVIDWEEEYQNWSVSPECKKSFIKTISKCRKIITRK